MSCECSGYCHKCKGMIWSLLGIVLMLNAFIWPKWNGVDGWLGFLGLLLMLTGVWKAYIYGCSCPKDNTGCCKHEEKPAHAEVHHEIHHEAPIIHHELPAVHRAPVHHFKKRKK